jgi:hypothetical protein
MSAINIAGSILKSISVYKKLQFEIYNTDYKELEELFIKRYPNQEAHVKKPYHTHKDKAYIDVTLNKWQTSDVEMMKLQNRVDATYPYYLTVIPEFYSFKGKDGNLVEGMLLRFVKMI